MQWLAVNVANYFGMDKKPFNERIQWVKDNLDSLELLADKADDYPLFIKAVKDLRDALAGKPVGTIVFLDASCSGLQILGLLSQDPKAMQQTNCVAGDIKYDAYTYVSNKVNQSKFFLREDTKQALMTYLYGSHSVPKKVFGADVDVFYSTVQLEFPHVYEIVDTLKYSHNESSVAHTWTLPDGFVAYCPNYVRENATYSQWGLEIALHKVAPDRSQRSISNLANVTHSVDAYLCRTMHRLCNYDSKTFNRAVAILSDVKPATKELNDKAKQLLKLYRQTKIADVSILKYLNAENVGNLPTTLRTKLLSMVESSLEHKPFELVTVHDAYGSKPQYCNYVRKHYNECLLQLHKSTLLNSILNQLRPNWVTVTNNAYVRDSLILNANYSLS